MLKQIITQQIRDTGPISVADYMTLCLQHPEHGYYRHAKAVGEEGDFITAPEISQIFGDLIGFWWGDMWQKMNFADIALVELGPGRGVLSADIMRQLDVIDRSNQPTADSITDKAPDTARNISLHLVESSETLRFAQAETVWRYAPTWHDHIASLPEDRPLFIMANEFFDALPIRQWVGAHERHVALDDAGELHFTPSGPVSREECPAAIEIMAQLTQRIQRQGGAILLVDYGYMNTPSAAQQADEDMPNGDTLQAVKDHQYHDPLMDCGTTDLTSHVDFTALAQQARQLPDLEVTPTIGQGAFLQRLGGDIWLQKLMKKASDDTQRQMLEQGWLRLISPLQMGELFKVMAISTLTHRLGGF